MPTATTNAASATLCAPSMTPSTIAPIPGMPSNRNISPKLNPPINCSPHVFFSRRVDSFSAANGPFRSTTRIGITRKVTSDQAMPSRPATNRPALRLLFSMTRSIRLTVVANSAQPAICGSRAIAADRPVETVGSPPRMRKTAQATMAELKKMMTK